MANGNSLENECIKKIRENRSESHQLCGWQPKPSLTGRQSGCSTCGQTGNISQRISSTSTSRVQLPMSKPSSIMGQTPQMNIQPMPSTPNSGGRYPSQQMFQPKMPGQAPGQMPFPPNYGGGFPAQQMFQSRMSVPGPGQMQYPPNGPSGPGGFPPHQMFQPRMNALPQGQMPFPPYGGQPPMQMFGPSRGGNGQGPTLSGNGQGPMAAPYPSNMNQSHMPMMSNQQNIPMMFQQNSFPPQQPMGLPNIPIQSQCLSNTIAKQNSLPDGDGCGCGNSQKKQECVCADEKNENPPEDVCSACEDEKKSSSPCGGDQKAANQCGGQKEECPCDLKNLNPCGGGQNDSNPCGGEKSKNIFEDKKSNSIPCGEDQNGNSDRKGNVENKQLCSACGSTIPPRSSTPPPTTPNPSQCGGGCGHENKKNDDTCDGSDKNDTQRPNDCCNEGVGNTSQRGNEGPPNGNTIQCSGSNTNDPCSGAAAAFCSWGNGPQQSPVPKTDTVPQKEVVVNKEQIKLKEQKPPKCACGSRKQSSNDQDPKNITNSGPKECSHSFIQLAENNPNCCADEKDLQSCSSKQTAVPNVDDQQRKHQQQEQNSAVRFENTNGANDGRLPQAYTGTGFNSGPSLQGPGISAPTMPNNYKTNTMSNMPTMPMPAMPCAMPTKPFPMLGMPMNGGGMQMNGGGMQMNGGMPMNPGFPVNDASKPCPRAACRAGRAQSGQPEFNQSPQHPQMKNERRQEPETPTGPSRQGLSPRQTKTRIIKEACDIDENNEKPRRCSVAPSKPAPRTCRHQ